jgi:hypothetical protein
MPLDGRSSRNQPLGTQDAIRLQRSVGNAATSARLRPTVARLRSVQRDPDAATLAAEGIEFRTLPAGPAGTIRLSNPASDTARERDPVRSDLVLGGGIPRNKGDDKRKGFDSQGEAAAFAVARAASTGAVVVKRDRFYFVMSIAANEHLNRKEVFQYSPAQGIAVAVGLDGFVFSPGTTYDPDPARTGKLDDPTAGMPGTPSVEELARVAGIPPAGTKEGSPQEAEAGKAAVEITPENLPAFLTQYLTAKAIQMLNSNEAEARKLAEEFKPTDIGDENRAASGVSSEAKKRIDNARKIAADLSAAQDNEIALEKIIAASDWERSISASSQAQWENGGVTKTLAEWRRDLGQRRKDVADKKNELLSANPVVGQLIPNREADSPLTTSVKAALDSPLAWVTGVPKLLWEVYREVSPENTVKDSPLANASDEKVRAAMQEKLDGVLRAIHIVKAKSLAGDLGFLLGMPRLVSEAKADFSRIKVKNTLLANDLDALILAQGRKVDAAAVIEVIGQAVQIGAFFFPPLEFVGAVITFGVAAHRMGQAFDKQTIGQAAASRDEAMVDVDQVQREMGESVLNLAMESVNLGMSLGEAAKAIEQGRTPKAMKGAGEAGDPTKKLPTDKEPGKTPKPDLPQKPYTPPSKEFDRVLRAMGIEGNPMTAHMNPHQVLKNCNGDWQELKLRLIAVKAEDKIAGEYVLYKMCAWRAVETESTLKEVVKALGPPHTYEAVGSAALTSDLDWSLIGPRAGEGVRMFNEMLSRKLGGRQPGTALDSNCYTRSAALDYPLMSVVDKSGKRLPIPSMQMSERTGVAKKAWGDFSAQTIGEATTAAEKARMKKVLAEAERVGADNLQDRIRHVANYKQSATAQVAMYESLMSKGLPEGPKAWKNHCDEVLAAAHSDRKALIRLELDEAAAIGARKEKRILEELQRRHPNEGWTTEKLHKAMHGGDADMSDRLLAVRNDIYAKELVSLEDMKRAYEKGDLSEPQKLALAAQINAQQSEALGYAAEAYATGGSLKSVVQNTQKAKWDFDHPAFGQMVANEARSSFWEQLGNMVGHAQAKWPAATKYEKYLLRAEKALLNHPFAAGAKGLSPGLTGALTELKKLKELDKGAPELAAWGKRFYGTSDVDAALKKMALHCDQEAVALKHQMGKLAGLSDKAQEVAWEEIAKNPARVHAIIARLAAIQAADGAGDS